MIPETMDVFWTAFGIALIAGLAVTVYCGAMWIYLSRREMEARRKLFESEESR